MTRVVSRVEIDSAIAGLDLVPAIEAAFVAYSAGRAVVPPVGELLLPDGEVHIKYGYLSGGDHYVIKVASGFPGNRDRGLPPNNGMMLLFSQASGEAEAVLLDEGWLTDVRTAVAGAVVAKHLAPSTVERIGIVGTGVQARLQVQHLESVTDCRDVAVWGRDPERAAAVVADLADGPWTVSAETDLRALPATCNLIVTTTASTEPLLTAAHIRPGTHITAMGSDTPDKQELDSDVLAAADVVIADSVEQCLLRGEIHQAIAAGRITPDSVVELGDVVSDATPWRTSDEQITVADLTGVAVQDLAIATAVLDGLG